MKKMFRLSKHCYWIYLKRNGCNAASDRWWLLCGCLEPALDESKLLTGSLGSITDTFTLTGGCAYANDMVSG
jgi:hypothetical protein